MKTERVVMIGDDLSFDVKARGCCETRQHMALTILDSPRLRHGTAP